MFQGLELSNELEMNLNSIFVLAELLTLESAWSCSNLRIRKSPVLHDRANGQGQAGNIGKERATGQSQEDLSLSIIQGLYSFCSLLKLEGLNKFPCL